MIRYFRVIQVVRALTPWVTLPLKSNPHFFSNVVLI